MGSYEDAVAHHRMKAYAQNAKSPRLPDPSKPGQIERHFAKEEHASWMAQCSCGAKIFLDNMNIVKLNEEIQYWHPRHVKSVFFKEAGGGKQYRGSIPRMDNGE